MPEQENNHPPVAANALFHFTNSIDNIENILTNEFLPKYCIEDWGFQELKNPTLAQVVVIHSIYERYDNQSDVALPMVCFCDIPLSQIRNHILKYGSPAGGGYGIGLKKEWGINRKITPVFYVHENSPALLMQGVFKNSVSSTQTLVEQDSFQKLTDKEQLLAISNNEAALRTEKVVEFIRMYHKPYKGRMWDKDKQAFEKKADFYEEREWRYIPNIDTSEIKKVLTHNEYLDSNIKIANEKKLKEYKLSFEPNNIKYIIVNKEVEIPEMIIKIREIKAKYSEPEKDLLISRIISMEHILADF